MSERPAAPAGLSPEQVFLWDVVATPSVSTQEAQVARLFTERLRELGVDRAWIDEAGNARAEVGEPDAPLRLLFLGHQDTVPGVVPVRLEEGRLYGRGSVDAKGPAVAFACALVRCQEAIRAAGVRVGFVACVEEEVPSSRGAHHAKTGEAPEHCIIGEPSGAAAVTLGYKGRVLCSYRRRAPVAHGAAKEASALDHGFAFHRAIIERAADFAPEGYHALQVTVRSANSQTDGLHDDFEMVLDIRVPPAASARDLADWIGTIDDQAEVVCESLEEPFEGEKRSPLVRAFTSAIRSVHGHRATLKRKTGTADMNVVGPAWRCPILAYGPGDSSLDHTPTEHIELDEFDRGVAVNELVIKRLLG